MLLQCINDFFFVVKTEEKIEEFGDGYSVFMNIIRKFIDAVRRRKGLFVEEKVQYILYNVACVCVCIYIFKLYIIIKYNIYIYTLKLYIHNIIYYLHNLKLYIKNILYYIHNFTK